MKKLLLACVTVSLTFCLYAEQVPSASVDLRITSRLPILPQEGCSGVFTVKNIGTVTFDVFTGKEWSAETTRFYRDNDDARQRVEDETVQGKQRRKDERKEVAIAYYTAVKMYPEQVRTLRPEESVTFESENFYFTLATSGWADIYKAEMYLGRDTWVPVTISPAIGYVRHVDLTESGKNNVFVFAREGTNQYLYIEADNGNFDRVGEMKLGNKPKKDREGAVTFDTTDGTKEKLTRERARQIIHEREQQKKQD